MMNDFKNAGGTVVEINESERYVLINSGEENSCLLCDVLKSADSASLCNDMKYQPFSCYARFGTYWKNIAVVRSNKEC